MTEELWFGATHFGVEATPAAWKAGAVGVVPTRPVVNGLPLGGVGLHQSKQALRAPWCGLSQTRTSKAALVAGGVPRVTVAVPGEPSPDL